MAEVDADVQVRQLDDDMFQIRDGQVKLLLSWTRRDDGVEIILVRQKGDPVFLGITFFAAGADTFESALASIASSSLQDLLAMAGVQGQYYPEAARSYLRELLRPDMPLSDSPDVAHDRYMAWYRLATIVNRTTRGQPGSNPAWSESAVHTMLSTNKTFPEQLIALAPVNTPETLLLTMAAVRPDRQLTITDFFDFPRKQCLDMETMQKSCATILDHLQPKQRLEGDALQKAAAGLAGHFPSPDDAPTP